jgi:hypothetical protein
VERSIHALARRLVITSVSLVAVGGLVAMSVPAAAGAATAAPAKRACVNQSGKTSNLATGPNGPHPTGGTVFTKPPASQTTCLDLNLTSVSATDHYEGWLQNSSTGVWSHCMAGFVPFTKGGPAKVLCSSVKPGTKMAVVQESATQRTITVEI